MNKEKTKLMEINAKSTSRRRLEEGDIEEVSSFTYLSSVVDIMTEPKKTSRQGVLMQLNNIHGAFLVYLLTQ